MGLVETAALVVLVAAPGEPPATYAEVPDLARAAIERRLDGANVQLQSVQVKPSSTLPGFVACGIAVERFTDRTSNRIERFFIVVPGTFAVLERDGKELIDHYWSLNRC